MFKRRAFINGLIAIATMMTIAITPLIGIRRGQAKDDKENEASGIKEYTSLEGELVGTLADELNLRISKNVEEYNAAQEIASQLVMEESNSLSRGGQAPKNGKGIMPVAGALSSTYGPRWGRQHKGIDIAADTGDSVFAFMPGKVISSGWNDGGYGYLVIIDHGNGIESYYAHNSKLLVKTGQYVEEGREIAKVGSTGRSTGPHLHFEVRVDGNPVNPVDFIK
ncbi:MAG: M23 family metallopeptidase [Clostridium sp.]